LGLITGTDAVCTRLAWASGWQVPADEIVDVTRADLTVAPDATMINSWGRKVRFDKGDLDPLLWHAPRNRHATYRALATRSAPRRQALGRRSHPRPVQVDGP